MKIDGINYKKEMVIKIKSGRHVDLNIKKISDEYNFIAISSEHLCGLVM